MDEFMQRGTGFALSVSKGLHGMIFHSAIEKQIPSIKESRLYQAISILFKYALDAVLVVPMIGLLLCIVAFRVSIACIPMIFAIFGNVKPFETSANEKRVTDQFWLEENDRMKRQKVSGKDPW